MARSAYEIGYDDGYNDREMRTEGVLRKLLIEGAPPYTSSALDSFDYKEYNRGYNDGMMDAARDWTAQHLRALRTATMLHEAYSNILVLIQANREVTIITANNQ